MQLWNFDFQALRNHPATFAVLEATQWSTSPQFDETAVLATPIISQISHVESDHSSKQLVSFFFKVTLVIQLQSSKADKRSFLRLTAAQRRWLWPCGNAGTKPVHVLAEKMRPRRCSDMTDLPLYLCVCVRARFWAQLLFVWNVAS